MKVENDHRICQSFLAAFMKDSIVPVTTSTQRRKVGTYRHVFGGVPSFEVTGLPDGEYRYGRACCAWSARYDAWMNWLQNQEGDAAQ